MAKAMTDREAHEIIRDLMKFKQNEANSIGGRLVELQSDQEEDPHETTEAMITRLTLRHAAALKQAEALAIAVSKF